MPFSSHHIKDRYCHHDFKLSMVPLIIFAEIAFARCLHLSLLSTLFFRKEWLCVAFTQGAGSYAPWVQSIYINYLEFFCTGDLSLLSHWFIQLFIDSEILTLESFQLAPVSFWQILIIMVLLCSEHFLTFRHNELLQVHFIYFILQS